MDHHERLAKLSSLKPALLVLVAALIVVLEAGRVVFPEIQTSNIQLEASDNCKLTGLGAANITNPVDGTLAFPLPALMLIKDYLPDVLNVGYITQANRNRSQAQKAASRFGLSVRVASVDKISEEAVVAQYLQLVGEGAEVIVFDGGAFWPIETITQAAASTRVPALHRQVVSLGHKLCLPIRENLAARE